MKTKEDIRKKKSKQAILQAFFSLLETKRFSKITVQNICEKAEISRSTFYDHFADKYALLQYGMDEWNRQNILNKPDLCFEDRLIYTLEDIHSKQKGFINLRDSETDMELLQMIKQYYTQFFKEMLLKNESINLSSNEHAEYFASFYAAGFSEITTMWCFQKQNISPQKMANILLEILPH